MSLSKTSINSQSFDTRIDTQKEFACLTEDLAQMQQKLLIESC